jgi:hypothetical protein
VWRRSGEDSSSSFAPYRWLIFGFVEDLYLGFLAWDRHVFCSFVNVVTVLIRMTLAVSRSVPLLLSMARTAASSNDIVLRVLLHVR